MVTRSIVTRKGNILFPAYIPVTTFGKKYPLDDLVRPYLPRLASALMVSYHYAKQQDLPVRLPLLIDSGGFASLFEKAKVVKRQGLGVIELITDDGIDTITPHAVLEFQEQHADVAFTLDFPIPPNLEQKSARLRHQLTIANALWAVQNRRRRDLPLYACTQGWDLASYLSCAKAYVDQGFEGIAIGGLVPRARDHDLLEKIVSGTRQIIGDLPLHVLGLGKPDLVERLFKAGADSVDSSSYVKFAADGRLWGIDQPRVLNASPMQRLHLALCNLANATKRNLPLSVSPHVLLKRE